jgi:hypothetical protein
MRKILLTAAVFGLSTGLALAQDAPAFADVDTDASGEISFEELQVAWPDYVQADFDAADTDSSGGLNADEFAAIGTGAATDTTMAPADTTTTPAPEANTGGTTTTTDVSGGEQVGNPTGQNGSATGESEDTDDDNNESGNGSLGTTSN